MEGSVHHPAQGGKALVAITSLQEKWQQANPKSALTQETTAPSKKNALFHLLGLSMPDAWSTEVNKFPRQNCSNLCKRSWRLLTPMNSRDDSRGVQSLVCFKYNPQKC